MTLKSPPLRLSVACIGLAILANKASAHEFWLSPVSYQIAVGVPVVADIRVGQKFDANAFSYIDFQIVRFDLVQGETITKVVGRMGDIPALSMAAPGEGLVTIVHETAPTLLTWEEWEKFTNFIKHKDLHGTLEAHQAMGLPEAGFKETYTRFAKSLVAVGNGAGSDQDVGLLTEIIALKNPYVDDLTGGLPVELQYQDRPRVHEQIEVYQKDASGLVTVTTVRTDDKGQAVIPVVKGMEYMLDSVVMLPLPNRASPDDPAFQSLWANLTFRVPD